MPPHNQALGGATIKLINLKLATVTVNNWLCQNRVFGWNGLTVQVGLKKAWPLLSRFPFVVRRAREEYIKAGYPAGFVTKADVSLLGDVTEMWCIMYEVNRDFGQTEDIYSDSFWSNEIQDVEEEKQTLPAEGDYDPFGEDDLNKVPVSFWTDPSICDICGNPAVFSDLDCCGRQSYTFCLKCAKPTLAAGMQPCAHCGRPTVIEMQTAMPSDDTSTIDSLYQYCCSRDCYGMLL